MKNAPEGAFLLGHWRKRRDSNPRWSSSPHTPLAGEHLRPLGHVSCRLDYALTWSKSKALCSARTANSMYFSSITTDVLISLVEII